MKAALAIAAVLVSTAALAQTSPGPPGPYVVDVRGTMSGIPSESAFFPTVPPATLVPKRAFGFGVGGGVYLFKLGPARVGFGVDFANARGTSSTPATATTTTTTTSGGSTPATTTGTASSVPPALDPRGGIDVTTRVSVVSPQISFNFGTREGWSYLSAGYGSASIKSEASGQSAAPRSAALTLTNDSERADAINYGGGARWFIKEHLAVGFDFRFQRLGRTFARPATKFTVLSVGVSVR